MGDDLLVNQFDNFSNFPCTCSDYAHLLTPAQMDLWELYGKDYLPCMALGIKRAIQWCQKVFKHELWNCTTWVGDYVMGRIVHKYGEFQRAKLACDAVRG